MPTDKNEMELEQSDLPEDSDVIGFLRGPVSDRPQRFRHTVQPTRALKSGQVANRELCLKINNRPKSINLAQCWHNLYISICLFRICCCKVQIYKCNSCNS